MGGWEGGREGRDGEGWGGGGKGREGDLEVVNKEYGGWCMDGHLKYVQVGYNDGDVRGIELEW